MNQNELIENQNYFKDLTSEEKMWVFENLKLYVYEGGDYIIRENECSEDLYFIKEGEVEVVKKNETTGQEFVINKLYEGDVIGEMAFIDRQPRSSSVRAANKPVSVYKFSVNWSDPHLSSLYTKILEKVVQTTMLHLRTINKDYVQNLKEHIRQVNEQNDFGCFFIFMVTIYTLNSFAKLFLSFALIDSHFVSLINFTLLLFLPTIGFVYYMGYSFENFGLTFKRTWQTLKETFFIAIGGLSLFGLIYSAWIGWPLFLEYLSKTIPYFFSMYAIMIFLYVFSLEFVARGTIQTSLQKFLAHHKEIGAVLLTAILIWPTNLYFGFGISFLKFLLDLFLGFVFIRQKNLIGVSILHYLFIMFSRTLF